ncbi:MAG: DUF1015 domain-containing protein [Deltaproteobacteria bacterium HGW-Deltaproteobacteria-7]|jgi:uncharacterized protein (DUF1015 family)|nr:MAG: DUF1015 domain-containing protein [Deltaproteobacteria bacterium HGW-Deltaproteobacteria-7]PKN50737.1 MAG: DUF1015 domain-containing protein [Deltaproteobacteria bacterium HGW-Deltaproteobacteria-13]
MAIVLPFKAVRPQQKFVSQVAALPYDVMTREEGQKAVSGNALSFMHVEKSEIDVPDGTKSDDGLIYQTAKLNFVQMQTKGILQQDESPCFYIYRQQMGSQVQTGIVGLMSASEYDAGKIKKHELTRQDKEEDRIRHVSTVNSQTGPVFISYRNRESLNKIVDTITAGTPEYDFTAEDGVRHTVWVVSDAAQIEAIKKEFSGVDALYIADGHHRAAAAANVARTRRNQDKSAGSAKEYESVLAVFFPDNQLKVMDYNRAVKDLNGLTPEKFIETISSRFTVSKNFTARSPQQLHDFGMYLGGEWYKITIKKGMFDESDPVASLDAAILQEHLLYPVLGIKDPRVDDRIKFIGGIRGMDELEKLVNKDGFAVAFSVYPTTMGQIIKVADAGAIMPPKSTWFEPKLRSGIFTHKLD